MRIKLHETPIFARAVERGEKLKSPLFQVIRNNYSELLGGTLIMVATYGLRPFLIVVTLAIIMFGRSFGHFLSNATMGSGASANRALMLVFLSLGMSLMGLTFGPMSALLPELFPTNTRYTGSGIAYNAASILGAALTPFVATWLAANYGPGAVGLYLGFLGGSHPPRSSIEQGNSFHKP